MLMNEQDQAHQFSLYLDDFTRSPGAVITEPEGMADMAQVVGALLALPKRLPPPDLAFQQQVWRQVRQAEASPPHPGWQWSWPEFRLRWLAPVAAALLLVIVMLPGPRTALGNWMARLSVGTVDVSVAPEEVVRPALAEHSQSYASQAEATSATGIALQTPAFLPEGFVPVTVTALSFDGLPQWLSPLFVETRFEPAGEQPAGAYLLLRQYNASQAGDTSLGELEYQSEDVDAAEEVALTGGEPAVLLHFDSGTLLELVWQRDGITFELWGDGVAAAELLETAGSVQ